MFNISPAAISKHYQKLNQIGVCQQDIRQGFDRPAYSDVETQAMAYIEESARLAGLSSRWDAVGNLIIETTGSYSRWVETGSHMDSVSGGGNYDGVAGVVAGLEVLIAAQAASPLTHGLRLRVWRGEESATFGTASLGSWAAVGQLNPDVLQRSHQGVSLQEAMLSQGAKPEFIEQGKATITQAELDDITAHIELHIEQGNLLERKSCDIGVVTGIRGSIRSWVRLHGAFDHSGATPMGSEHRKDANLAMAHMMVELDGLLQRFHARNEDVVQTFGAVNSHGNHNQRFPLIHKNAVSKVSGFAYFSFEVRSCAAGVAAAYYEQAQALISEVADSFQVEVEIELISESASVPCLDEAVQQTITDVCRKQHRSYDLLVSGAWHDVAVLSKQKKTDGTNIATGLIFIPCLAGISHSAAEYSSAEQIAAGASVLAEVMLSL